MQDALSGVDGTQALPPLALFPDAVSGVVRRTEPVIVWAKVERERKEAARRAVERAVPTQRARSGASAEPARQTASVPDAYAPTRRSSVVPQQNLVAPTPARMPDVRPYG